MEFVVALWRDEVLPAFDGEHDLNVDLCVGVGHARKMPLLTELGNHFWAVSTKMTPLTGLKNNA